MTFRRILETLVTTLSQRLGRYEDWAAEEQVVDQADAVPFAGDIPHSAGDEHNQYRLVLRKPPPLVAAARQVVYTDRGMAWLSGVLHRRFCFQEVGLRDLVTRPGAVAKTYARASILQGQTPATYGDWMSEHVASLARAKQRDALVEPLLIPGWWLRKPYVRRDLAALGIRAEAVDASVGIERAVVINKTRRGHYWTREEVQAVMTEMNIRPRDARPGTSIYLSRFGEKGEGPQRQINNAVTEAALASRGVKVVRTRGCTPEDYIALAGDAETVFADHGSAGYNLMYWKTRRVVEFFPPDYWDSAFLFLAQCLDIDDYHLWRVAPTTTVAEMTDRIDRLFSVPPPVRARPPGRLRVDDAPPTREPDPA